MGSIPTHSRQTRSLGAALLAAACLAGGAPAARAAETVPAGTPSPFARALRSTVFPAWGQLTNGKSKKAVVIFAAQTYLWTRVIEETRAAHHAERRARALADPDDAESVARERAARAAAQEHFDTRRDLLFWSLLGAFYGATDAYVDAHLGRFGEELEEGRQLFAGVDPVARGVELGVRF